MNRKSTADSNEHVPSTASLMVNSGVVGLAIMLLSTYMGGGYATSIEQDLSRAAAELRYNMALVSFTTYMLINAVLVVYMAQKEARGWKLNFFVFLLIPLAIFWLAGYTLPLLSLPPLWIVASGAVYQARVMHYRHR